MTTKLEEFVAKRLSVRLTIVQALVGSYLRLCLYVFMYVCLSVTGLRLKHAGLRIVYVLRHVPLMMPSRWRSTSTKIIAERLSARLLIVQCSRLAFVCIPYSGKFFASTNFRESPTNTPGKNFCDFYFRVTRSRYLTTPPTIFRMEIVTLSVYFNVKTTVRR